MVQVKRFHTAMTHVSSVDIDHTRGRAQIVNGSIVYSPNCGRTINMPPSRDEVTQVRSSLHSDVDPLHEPLWWADDTAFLAFLPINPDFTGVPFEEFNNPTVKRYHRSGYGMGAATALRWRRVEFHLQHVVGSFMGDYSIPASRSFIDTSAIHCSGTYEYPSMFRRQLKRTKGWLSLLIAKLAYVIAVAQECDGEQPCGDRFPTWFLKRSKWDQVLLSGIRSSVARYTYSVPRVGIFLKICDAFQYQPPIDFFLKYSVPVWYRWTAEDIRKVDCNSKLKRLTPLPEELQRVAQFLTKPPSLSGAPEEDTPWVNHFKERQRILELDMKVESPTSRQSRLDRERNPPVVNTKVFVWECGSDGKFLRGLTCKRDNEATLSRFSPHEKIYQSHWNEWDCCHAFQSTASQREQDDYFNSDSDDLDLPEVDAVDLLPALTSNPPPTAPVSDHMPSLPPPPSDSLPLETDVEPSLARWEPYFHAPDSAHTYDVTTYPATETLHYFFGFVPPVPVPRKHPKPVDLGQKDYQLFAAIVNEDGLDKGFRDSTIMQYCHQFVKGLERSNVPPNELFDLALGNPMCLRGVKHIRFIRRRNDLFSLALPASDATVPWDLTVTNPIDALFLCRLDAFMTEVDLCRILLQRGMQFRTLLPIARRQVRPSTIPSLVLPIRGAGYIFSKTDYVAYLEERVEFIRNIRLRRAALMTGGIVWRLVVSEVSFDEAFLGPTAATTIHGRGFFLSSPDADYHLCDDILTDSEAEAIAGRVYCHTGRGKQCEEKSWWPTDRQWKSFVAHTRWGDQQEKFFKNRKRALEAGTAKPLNATEWRKLLRSAHTARVARSNMEETAGEFLNSTLKSFSS